MGHRYRSMDFFRSIAILMVILSHSILSYGAPQYLSPLQLGGTGVDLFFVLSGWLLGGQLFKEINIDGNVSIRKFWIRRWMRTLPAYYAVLMLSVTQRLITKDNIDFPYEYFVFLQNYNSPLEFFSISWSLCVEEQFYLFIAPFLSIFAQRKKQYLSLLLLIIFFCPTLFRYFELYDYINETHVRFDGCILGVLLAQARYQYHFIWLKMAESSIAVGTLGLIIFVSMVLTKYYPDIIYVPRDKLLLACIFGSWVLLANKNDYWRTLLYFPGCNYIATRSYALYLLHPEILALAKRYLIDVHFVYYFAFVLVGSIAIAEVLYLLIEKPIMDAREKFSFSKTKDLPKQATRI